ncbi:MAG: LysM peptidoglycan-binding domain-containing protein [Caldilineaceae bacterium]
MLRITRLLRQPNVLPSLFCALILALISVITFRSPLFAQSDAYSSLSSTSQAIVDAINQMRANAGRPPLQVSQVLNFAAQGQANDVAAHVAWGHYGSDGSTVRTRVNRLGYNSDWVGENWILTASPGDAMRWWMSDPPHAENILQANYTEIGIGETVDPQTGLVYWFTDFARSNGAVTPDVQSANVGNNFIGAEPTVQVVPAGGLDYTIQPGDTLLVIGLRHGLDWETVAEANGLTGHSILQIGQVVHIPGGGAVGGSMASAELANARAASYTGVYTINSGDTLDRVAGKYDVTWQELAAINGLGEWSVLQIGQVIKVPGAEATPDPEVAPADNSGFIAFSAPPAPPPADDSGATYTIKAGDTIFVIAMRHNLDWQELLRINNLTEDSLLQPGQQIRLK